jgi:hypothetical protein
MGHGDSGVLRWEETSQLRPQILDFGLWIVGNREEGICLHLFTSSPPHLFTPSSLHFLISPAPLLLCPPAPFLNRLSRDELLNIRLGLL